MEKNELEKIEIYEKNGIGELRFDGKKIKWLTEYNIKRNADTVDLTINISAPTSNFETKEKSTKERRDKIENKL